MMNRFEKANEIYSNLKDYISNKSKFKPEIKRTVIKNIYPLVVFEELTNTLESVSQDCNSLEEMRNLSYEINIYAIPQNEIDADQICSEIANLVMNIMQKYYHMQGGLDARFININSSKATQYTLRFYCKWYMARNMIY